MDFLELVHRRQSVRSYDPSRPVENEKLERCIEALRLAPSACNAQTWKLLGGQADGRTGGLADRRTGGLVNG